MGQTYNFSLIIPHHNCPDLLDICINSVPIRNDLQIIVIDDNSDADKKPHEFNRPVDVIFISKEESRGAGHARNVGLSKAKGKWLMFSDSDDFFDEKLNSVLNKYVDDTSDLIYFNYCCCALDEVKKVFSNTGDYLFDHYERTKDPRFLSVSYGFPWCKLVKRCYVEDNNITFQELSANNDSLFSAKVCLYTTKIKVDRTKIYNYVLRNGSIVNSVGLESYEKIKDRVLSSIAVQKLLDEMELKASKNLISVHCANLLHKKPPYYLKVLKLVMSYGFNPLLVIKDSILYYIKKILRLSGEETIVMIEDKRD